ncbi:hypothetical protein X798_07597 [Onchocerca flexuosa]|uniref:Peptidase M13 N-terminal domain-containing protein n=1 Tax=Onchocerca flexuosa TaxID=387005 RepID=A0A238BIY8_9BILA|nr:hypothetical protein X798_07597 [Onchocerca flexuosa]
MVQHSTVEFEERSSKMITLSEDLRHNIAEMYNKMTIEQMRKEFPNFNWLLFFNTIFQYKYQDIK